MRIRKTLAIRILDIAPDAIMIIDSARCIMFFNQAAERIFGFSAEEILGKSLETLVPAPLKEVHSDLGYDIASALAVARPMSTTAPIEGRRKDGTHFPAEVNISKLIEDDQTLFIAVVRDVSERLAAEEALNRWQQLFEHAQWGIAICTPESMRLEMMNPVFAKMHGYSIEELVGRPLGDLAAPEQPMGLAERMQLASERSLYTFETRHRCKDGSVFPGYVDVTTVRDAQGTPLYRIVNVRDITARRRVEEALLESEERLRALVDNSIDGVLLTAPDGRIFAANPEARRMFGRSEEEICQAGRAGLVDASDPQLKALLDEQVCVGRFRGKLIHLRKDGTRFPAEVSAGVFTNRHGEARTSMIVRDITEREQVEFALREREAQYRSIFETVTDGLFINTLDGHIVAVNPAACRMYGYSSGELVGLDLRVLFHTSFHHLVTDWGDDVKAGKLFETDAVSVRKDSTEFHAHFQATHFSYAGEPHILGIVRDISERVQAYRLLEQRVAERTRELSALLEVSRNVASTLDLGSLLSTILRQLKSVIDYSGAAIAILEGKTLKVVEYQGPVPRDEMLQLNIPPDMDTGYMRVVRQCAPVIINGMWEETLWLLAQRNLVDEELRSQLSYAHSWMGVPLIAQGQVIGVLRVDHTEPEHFTQRHAELALAFAEQAATAIQNVRLYEQGQQLAILEERYRLARELHDSVSQALYGIVLGTQTALVLLERNSAEVAEALRYVVSLAESAFAEMRSLIFELRPNSLETEGVVAALERQIDVLRSRERLQVQTDFGSEPDVPLLVKETLLRIAQEALHNIVKHAHAHNIAMRMELQSEEIVLEISDDGVGFNAKNAPAGHFGLRTMRERAEHLHGSVLIQSYLGAGTQLRVRIPRF